MKLPEDRKKLGERAGITGIICNLLLSGAKIAAGALAGSLSVMADGFNNITDAASSIFTVLGFKLSAKPADREHPFGHARSEYIAGLVISFFVLLVGVEVGRSSVQKIIDPGNFLYSDVAVFVLAASILVKAALFLYYKNAGRRISSTVLYAAASDSRNDVIATGAVLICLIITRFTGFSRLDGIAGLAVAVFILVSGVKLVGEALSPLLGRAPDEGLVAEITKKVLAYEGVLGMHDLIVHDYGPERRFVSLHCEVDYSMNIMQSHELADLIERDFAAEDVHVVIHLDPVVVDDPELNLLKSKATEVLKKIDSRFSLHDFRMVKGDIQHKVLFDAQLPHGYKGDVFELVKDLERELRRYDEKAVLQIEFENCYTGME